MYDRATVEYIVESEEGRKYWHYFKHMLLGSEEHYYVSLLYNWPRTRGFVQSLSAQVSSMIPTHSIHSNCPLIERLEHLGAGPVGAIGWLPDAHALPHDE